MNQILEAFLPLLQKFWWVIPILLISAFFSSPMGKGIVGEFTVKLTAKIFLDKSTYHLINNVTIPTDDGGTTQIDHIVVSQLGLFVIETKNYKGWIYGSESQKKWTQKIFKSSFKFQNPLHQNYKHTKTLESLLGIQEGSAVSIVTFVGNSTFKTPMPLNVCKGGQWVQYIRTFKHIVFTPEEKAEMIQMIEDNRLSNTWKTHREHVAYVKGLHENKKEGV
jgi:restriction system protein